MNKAQRRLVVWGTVAFALVMNLLFCRWTVQEVSGNITGVVPDLVWLSAADWLGRQSTGVAISFGVLAPLALVGVAGYFYLGGRKPKDNTGSASGKPG